MELLTLRFMRPVGAQTKEASAIIEAERADIQHNRHQAKTPRI